MHFCSGLEFLHAYFFLTSHGTKKLCVYDKNKNNIFIIIVDEFKFEKPLYFDDEGYIIDVCLL